MIVALATTLLMVWSGIALASASFDADGYYVPIEGELFEGFRIEYLAIHLTKAVPPRVYLAVRDPNGQVERQVCRDPSVSRDGIRVRCQHLRVGNVELTGTFRDKTGQYWNRLDEIRGTTVLTIVSVQTRRGDVRQTKVQFTYTGGD
jgi:hypothetical protein